MQIQSTTRIFISQRALALGVLFVYLLCIGGCCTFMDKTCRKVFHPRVCPTCNAHRIDQCHCFSASDNVGYHETNWISISPVEEPVSHPQPVPEESLPAELPATSDLPNPDANSTFQVQSTPLPVAPLQLPKRLQENLAQPTHVKAPSTNESSTDGVQQVAFKKQAQPTAVRISDETGEHETVHREENASDYFKP